MVCWRQLLALGALAAALSGAGVASAAAITMVEGIRVGSTPGRTRVVLDLTTAAPYRIVPVDAANRIAIELEQTELAAPAGADLFAGTVVSELHSAPVDGGNLRLELWLREPGLRLRSFTMLPEKGRGHRLVLDLYQASHAGTVGESSATATRAGSDTTATVAGDLPTTALAPQAAAPVRSTASVASEPAPGPQRPPAGAATRQSPPSPGLEVSFSGTLEQEWAYASTRSRHQKFETLIEPRWDVQLPGGGASLTAIGRLRLDAVGDLGPDASRPDNYSSATAPWHNNSHSSLSLRELYLDFRWAGADWRLGKQQVVWGQADGIKVLDVVNPQSYREFILDDFDQSRIPLWMANVNLPVGDAANLQLLWIPDTTYHELAEPATPFAARSPRLLPPLPVTAMAEAERPDNPLRDGDFGFALSTFAGGWDLSLNYLYHYLDTPALRVRPLAAGQLLLAPEYRRNHMLGGTFGTALGSVTLRGELAYNSDTYQPLASLRNAAVGESAELSSVLGLDWMPDGDTLISGQWFNSYLLDHERDMNRDSAEQLLTLLYQRDFANATWQLRALGMHSINDSDSLLQLKLRYWLRSNLELWVGADIFEGSRRGLFGQYDSEDRLLFGLQYGF